jgi:anaerobic selenocysteine-containing dehydrogenase
MNTVQVFDKVVWSTCNVNCGSRCPVRLFVKEGEVVRIEPDNTQTRRGSLRAHTLESGPGHHRSRVEPYIRNVRQ